MAKDTEATGTTAEDLDSELKQMLEAQEYNSLLKDSFTAGQGFASIKLGAKVGLGVFNAMPDNAESPDADQAKVALVTDTLQTLSEMNNGANILSEQTLKDIQSLGVIIPPEINTTIQSARETHQHAEEALEQFRKDHPTIGTNPYSTADDLTEKIDATYAKRAEKETDPELKAMFQAQQYQRLTEKVLTAATHPDHPSTPDHTASLEMLQREGVELVPEQLKQLAAVEQKRVADAALSAFTTKNPEVSRSAYSGMAPEDLSAKITDRRAAIVAEAEVARVTEAKQTRTAMLNEVQAAGKESTTRHQERAAVKEVTSARAAMMQEILDVGKEVQAERAKPVEKPLPSTTQMSTDDTLKVVQDNLPLTLQKLKLSLHINALLS